MVTMPERSAARKTAAPRRRRPFLRALYRNRMMILMCLPAIVFFFVFSYLPMPGAYMAFVNYRFDKGIFRSPFAGFSNFDFLIKSGSLWNITKNTLYFNFLFLVTGTVAQVAFAIMLNEIRSRWYKKVTQTLLFLPYFISYVLVGLFTYSFINYDTGVINNLFVAIGLPKIQFYSEPKYWPGILTFINLWKGVGYGSVVYLAAITGMDQEIMEAAAIDGASTWQRIRYITIPWLRPTVVLLTLFAVGGILKGNFGLFYNTVGANNVALYESTDIIETFVWRALMTNMNFPLGSAAGLYQSFFGMVLVMTANYIVKRIEPDYALF